MPQPRTLVLSEQETAELVERRDHDSNPQVRERCAALLKIAAGSSAHAVAQTGLLKRRDPDTVYQWLDYYTEGGIAQLVARLHGGGRRGRL